MCDVPSFLNHSLMESVLLPTIQGARATLTQYGNPSTLLVLEETASAAGGGCVNISDRFLSGFIHLHDLGLVAEAGYDRIHRQVSALLFLFFKESKLEPPCFSRLVFPYALGPGWLELRDSGQQLHADGDPRVDERRRGPHAAPGLVRRTLV